MIDILTIVIHWHSEKAESNYVKVAQATKLGQKYQSKDLKASKSSHFIICGIHIKRLNLIAFLFAYAQKVVI